MDTTIPGHQGGRRFSTTRNGANTSPGMIQGDTTPGILCRWPGERNTLALSAAGPLWSVLDMRGNFRVMSRRTKGKHTELDDWSPSISNIVVAPTSTRLSRARKRQGYTWYGHIIADTVPNDEAHTPRYRKGTAGAGKHSVRCMYSNCTS